MYPNLQLFHNFQDSPGFIASVQVLEGLLLYYWLSRMLARQL